MALWPQTERTKYWLKLNLAVALRSIGSYGYAEPKNVIAFSVEQTHWALRTGKKTRFHTPPYSADNGNMGSFEGFDRHGTAFEPKQCLYQNVAMGMQNLKL